jgi:hypothetical protein
VERRLRCHNLPGSGSLQGSRNIEAGPELSKRESIKYRQVSDELLRMITHVVHQLCYQRKIEEGFNEEESKMIKQFDGFCLSTGERRRAR